MSDWFGTLLAYLMLGGLTMAGIGATGAVPETKDSYAACFAIILFWPLYVIKYLAIGIWMVLSAAGATLV